MPYYYNREPKLSDYGLTEAKVRKNEIAKATREKIIKENQEIDKKAMITGWSLFGVISVIGIIICVAMNNAAAILGALVFGGILGYAFFNSLKKQKKVVPYVDSSIDTNYNKYKVALKNYQEQQSKKAEEKVVETKTTKKGVILQSIKTENGIVYGTSNSTNKKTTSTKKGMKQELKNLANISAEIDLTEKTINDNQSSKTTDLEKGMIISHPKFGMGRVLFVDKSDKSARIQFEDDYSIKMIMYNLVDMKILENPKPKVEEKPKSTAQTVKIPVSEPITKTYEKSGISLTKSQEKLFDELYKESLKYCVDLQVSEWRQYVGVGLIGQEHLRFWLTKRKDVVYVKFGDTQKSLALETNNRFDLISMTRQVNENFEKDPEKYMLATYKEQQKKLQEELAEEEKQSAQKSAPLKEERNIDDLFVVDEAKEQEILDKIFGVEETDDISVDIVEEQKEESTSFEYDKSIYEITGTTLTKFIGQEKNAVYEIPQGVEELAESCFSGNNLVYELTLPNSVKVIKDKVFKDCKKLRLLILPSSITEIGQNVLDGCDNLETVFCETKAVRKLLVNVPKHIEIVCLEF